MDFSLKRHVYCHDLKSPPSQGRSCDVDMKLVNSKGLVSIERVGHENAETDYRINIPSGNNLGFASSEQSILDNDFHNFVLALNLTQGRICINEMKGGIEPDEVTLKVPEPKTTVTKSDCGAHFHAEELYWSER